MTRFFNPDAQPYRDHFGFTSHPDLALFTADDGGPNRPALLDAGFVLETVALGDDHPGLLEGYLEGDEFAIRRWDPTPPEGDGWQLVAVYDTESDPLAVFVQRLS